MLLFQYVLNPYYLPISIGTVYILQPALTFAFISSIQGDSCLAENIIFRHPCKRMTKGQVFIAKQLFICKTTFYIFTVVTITWLSMLLIQAGDIHPNPGSLSTS